MPKPSFAAVKQAAHDNLETLCSRLLPHGKREGEWWRSKVPWRAGDGRNLAVSLTSGIWRDWARPGEEGDIFQLLSRIDNCSEVQARDQIAGILGLGDVPDGWKPAPAPAAPKCKDCKHAYLRRIPHPWVWCCGITVLDDGERPESVPTRVARRSAWKCGPAGRLFERRADV